MKIFQGKVVKKSGEKTAKVAVERVVAHTRYKKRLKRTKFYLVHDEIGVKTGEVVRFTACKPFSKLKKWRIIEEKKKKGTKK